MSTLVVILTILAFDTDGNLLSVETSRFDDPAVCSAAASGIGNRMRARGIDPATYDISCATY